MRMSAVLKDKKGAAMIYAIMVLLLLTTVIVALTALSTASYNDAVISVSDDQSYYYAKSIGLAIKEQFKDGYSIGKIIESLDEAEKTHSEKWKIGVYYDPTVTGNFNVSDDKGQVVNGTLRVSYARNADDTPNRNVIEVRTACVVNNSPAVVTSIYSCEKDTGKEAEHLAETLTEYDVVLTTGINQDFDFTQAADSTGSSSVNVYVYTDEDWYAIPGDRDFRLYYDMYGKLTTTGNLKIYSRKSKAEKNTPTFHTISGNLTSYGNVTLNQTGVMGVNGIHADGNVELQENSFCAFDIFAHGTVTIKDPGWKVHNGSLQALGWFNGYVEQWTTQWHSARNIAATSAVSVGPRAVVTGNIYSQGDVDVCGLDVSPYTAGSADHFGNTYVGGSVYAAGNVYIRSGAVVRGDVIANGRVTVERGAFVCGNVTSVKDGVAVHGAGIGGQVNAANYLWVQNYQTPYGGQYGMPEADYTKYAQYLREFDFSGTGTILYGGIGLFQPAGVTYKHTCGLFGTDNGEYVPIVRGDLHVKDALEEDYTPFKSVWCQGRVYLENSRARFKDWLPRTHVGISPASIYHLTGITTYPSIYVYTYIQELNQQADFAETIGDNAYLEMYGARIDKLNVGTDMNDLYDAYPWKGWIGNINCRCLFAADMQLDGYIYCSQYCEPWGTNTNWVAYDSPNYSLYSFAYGYTIQASGTTIEVACRKPSYQGIFASETRRGFYLAKCCQIYGLVNVGCDSAEYEDPYVILGDESLPGTSYLIGGMNAFVSDFTITANMRLSDSYDVSIPATWAATILAEIFDGGGNVNYVATSGRPANAANSFYVAESGASGGVYRVGSMIQVKGKAVVAGVVGNFQHFMRDDGTGSFANATTARVKGTFVSTGLSLNLIGTDVFNEVLVTNANSVTRLTGAFAANVLRINGKLDINLKTLTVRGDAYIGMLASNDLYCTVVYGNLTIGSINDLQEATLTASSMLIVTGDLYLGKGNIELTSAFHKINGTVQTGLGNLTMSGNATVVHAHVNGWLNVQGGALTGDFLAVVLNVTGGTVGLDKGDADATVGYYVHSGGTIQRLHVWCIYDVWNSVQISGTAVGKAVYIDTEGGAVVTGGSSVDYYDGCLRSEKGDISIRGGFRCGISANSGNLLIGSSDDVGEYKVGVATSYNKSSDSYRAEDSYNIMHASGYVIWNGKAARGTYSEQPKFAGATEISAGNYIKIGTADVPVKGYFRGFYSKNSSVEAYVGSVISVKAKTSAKVYVMGQADKNTAGFIGRDSLGDDESQDGIKTETGDIHVNWLVSDRGAKTKTAIIQGHFECGGNFYFDGKIDAIARIKCKDIYNLDKVVKHNDALWLSLYLFNPTGSGSIKKDSDGFFELKDSFAVHQAGIEATKWINNKQYQYTYTDTGSFSINGNLKYAAPVRVEGQLYVNGILKYKKAGASSYSETDLVCLGGLHCLNTTVNLPADAKGDVDLPNVTSVTLNGDIGLKADKVTSITLSNNTTIGRSLNLPDCTSFTVSSGCKINGSLVIKSTGKVVNNGTIGEKVSCGYYEGSGSVGLDLILNQKDKTSKIKSGGSVSGNIWSAGSIEIDTTETIGGRQTYIFAKQNITIKNARLYYESDYYQMQYIFSSGGNILLQNCSPQIPKVWNTKGNIRFLNDSSHRGYIKSVLSYGTYIDFGSSDDGSAKDDYQTVKGDVEWAGKHTSGYAVDFRNGTHTQVNGNIWAKGEGNVKLRNAKILGYLVADNVGKVEGDSACTIGTLIVNNEYNTNVTSVNIAGWVKGDAVLWASSSASFTLGTVGTAGNNNSVRIYGGKTVTISEKVQGVAWAKMSGSGGTFKVRKGATGNCEVWGGTMQIGSSTDSISAEEASVGGNVVAYNANLKVYGNVGSYGSGAAVLHSAPSYSKYNDFKLIQLGLRDKQISIYGGIIAHGRVVDNSKQIWNGVDYNLDGSKAYPYIWVKGAYYVDFKKNLDNCAGMYFTSECNGSCTVIGDPTSDWTINTPFDIAGRLVVLSFYESSNKWHKIYFNNTVKANAIVVNSELDGTGNIDYIPNSSIPYSNDNGKYLEDFTTYNVEYNIWKSKRKFNVSTAKNLVVFNRPVYAYAGNGFNGSCIAANTTFNVGSCLFTEGQVALRDCELFSLAYASDTVHCYCKDLAPDPNVTWWTFSHYEEYINGNQYRTIDGSMFVHSSSATGGANYLKGVKIHSNVSIYNNTTYAIDCEFTNPLISTTNGYLGYPTTKLLYFGGSFYMKNTSIKAPMNADSCSIPAGRTIIWVKNGTFVCDGDSYVGDQKYGRSPGGLNTDKQSFHPGIFVSKSDGKGWTVDCKERDKDENKTAAFTDSETYYKGGAAVKGSVTLDILAYHSIKVYGAGVVVEKGDNDTDVKAYKAGLYVTRGNIQVYDTKNEQWLSGTSNPSKGGFFGLFSCSGKGMHYYCKQSNRPADDENIFIPCTTAYVEYMVKSDDSPYSSNSSNFATYATWNLWSYTPQDYPVAFLLPGSVKYVKPVGVNVNPLFPTWMTQATRAKPEDQDPYFLNYAEGDWRFDCTAAPTEPDKPDVSASGTIYGDASVSPVGVHNTSEYLKGKDKFCNDTISYNADTDVLTYHPIYGANIAFGAPDIFAYVGGRANEVSLSWIKPNYDTSDVLIKRPSLYWTATITNNFDTTVKEYWNTRFIPYVWKLPYDTADGATPAKRVLTVKEYDRGGSSGDFDLTEWTDSEAVGDSYFLTENHYTGSNLAKRAGDLKGWRKNGASGDALWDVVVINASGGSHKRRCKLLVFESGELPFSAFMMGNGNYSEDMTSHIVWDDYYTTHYKKIANTEQYAWLMGGSDSNYDVTWIFYACADPANPYESEAKDLHVVLPQGIATQFIADGNTQVTVVGKGRVFLYLTSGDTIYIKGKAISKSTTGYLWWQHTSTKACFLPPVGGLKKVDDTTYEPQLYFIGAGTYIDLYIEDMPMSAVVYMPFGHSHKLYATSSTSLGDPILPAYNRYQSLVDGHNFSTVGGKNQKTWYSPTGTDTARVRYNQVTLSWTSDSSGIELSRWLYGQIITDNLYYKADKNSYNLSFMNEYVKPNLGKTTIYDYSTDTNSMRGGQEYTLDSFLVNAPSYSRALLYWEYIGMKVEA